MESYTVIIKDLDLLKHLLPRNCRDNKKRRTDIINSFFLTGAIMYTSFDSLNLFSLFKDKNFFFPYPTKKITINESKKEFEFKIIKFKKNNTFKKNFESFLSQIKIELEKTKRKD